MSCSRSKKTGKDGKMKKEMAILTQNEITEEEIVFFAKLFGVVEE